MRTTSREATVVRRALHALDTEARALADGRPAPATPPPPRSSFAPIVRPNGEVYHPREVADGRSDVDALRACRADGLYVLLHGHPGVGKTALVEAAFGDLETVAGHGDALVEDFVGRYTQAADGSFVWHEGPLPRAMRKGCVLFVDDATLIPPGVLARLYPAMDGRDVIRLAEHTGEEVRAAPGFFVVAAHNPGVPGAVLSEALGSRFTLHLEVRTDFRQALDRGIDRRVVAAAAHLSALRRKGELSWAPEMRELLGFLRLSSALSVDLAVRNLIGLAPAEDRDTVRDALANDFPGACALSVGDRA